MFKLCAFEGLKSGSFFNAKPAIALISAVFLYGITSIAWVWILQKVPLGRIYPLMALAFLLVPLGSFLVFGEKFPAQYLVGIFLIIVGVLIVVRT